RVPAIVGPEQALGAEIDRPRVVRRQHERSAPEEPEVRSGFRARDDVAARRLLELRLLLGCQRLGACSAASALAGLTFGLRRARTDGAAVAPAEIDAVRVAVLRLGVDHHPVGRILRGVEAITAADPEPVV